LKLRYSRLWEIYGAKTQEIIITRRVSFEVALIKTVADQRRENMGDHHNPTRQRGIFPNTSRNAEAQSLAHAAGWDSRKRATSKRVSEGFSQTLRETQKLNPSLTQRVGIVANAQIQNA
jgi:hypothetical protein